MRWLSSWAMFSIWSNSQLQSATVRRSIPCNKWSSSNFLSHLIYLILSVRTASALTKSCQMFIYLDLACYFNSVPFNRQLSSLPFAPSKSIIENNNRTERLVTCYSSESRLSNFIFFSFKFISLFHISPVQLPLCTTQGVSIWHYVIKTIHCYYRTSHQSLLLNEIKRN